MKLEGKIEGNKVLILIDSGPTSNFISTSVARRLGLVCTDCKPFGVTLGTGAKVYGDGICRQIRLSLQGIDIVEDFFSLELGSLDVILGVQWLEKLGTVIINWKPQEMKFTFGDRNCALYGDPYLRCSQVCEITVEVDGL